MRISQGLLLKNARNVVAERVYHDRRIICIYLTGSLLSTEDYLLGGTTDIDLVCVHDTQPTVAREVQRVTEDVHLDIAHHSQQDFLHTRQVRVDPWLGSFLCKDPIVLHDMNHWFDFVQASVCAQFFQPEHVFKRAQSLVDDARRRWFRLGGDDLRGAPALLEYLKVLENSANGVAVLSGFPLTERRFLLNFPERAQAIERPDLAEGFFKLFNVKVAATEQWLGWLKDWEAAFLAAGKVPNCPARLHPCRRAYYVRAADAMFPDHPVAALWPILRTWALAAAILPQDHPACEGWNEMSRFLLLDDEHLSDNLENLDGFLDLVEETVDTWAEAHGIDPLN